MGSENGHVEPHRSLTYRDGDRVLVKRFVPPPTPPTAAELVQRRLCPDGHMPPGRHGHCPRCGKTLQGPTGY